MGQWEDLDDVGKVAFTTGKLERWGKIAARCAEDEECDLAEYEAAKAAFEVEETVGNATTLRDAVMAMRLSAAAGLKESQDYEALIAKAESRLQETIADAQEFSVAFADNSEAAQVELDGWVEAVAAGREGKENNDLVVFLREMRKQIEDGVEKW
ncbi:unnamed protein product [Amoebophrya sp. A120]|nr:unnamed protein product [Amoebophrya sp. A120]|eukprot:GSA120T00018400001.1